MLIRVSGYNSGVKEYLEEGIKNGRDYTREELDERLILYGDLDLTEMVYKLIPDKGQNRYTTFTLSFKEDAVPEQTLKEITKEFREFMMYAYEDDEYSFYAEAHIPKIKEMYDRRTGEHIDRKPHIHIVIPKINLLSGNVSDVIGDPESTERYLEAFQEYINQKYQLSSPREHVRVNPYNAADVLSRYKGDDFRGRHREFKQELVMEIIDGDIRSRDAFYSLVAVHGETRIRNAGKENEYIAVKLSGDEKFTNLKETIFQDSFIRERKVIRPPLEKHVIADRLQSWPVRAKEIKYVVPAGEKFRNKYYRGSEPAEKLTLLAERQYSFYEQYGGNNELHPAQRSPGDERSTSQDRDRGSARPAGGLQGMPGSDVAADGNTRSTTGAVFLPGNARVDLEQPAQGGDSGLRSDLPGRRSRRREESRSGSETGGERTAGSTESGGEGREGRERTEAGRTTPGAGAAEGGRQSGAGRESPSSGGAESPGEGRQGSAGQEAGGRSPGAGRRESEQSENPDTTAGGRYPDDPGSREEYRYAWIPGVGGSNPPFHVRGGYGSGNRQLTIPPYARNPAHIPGFDAVEQNTAILFSDTVQTPVRPAARVRLINRVMPRQPRNASYVAACLQRQQSRASLSTAQQKAMFKADQTYFDSRRAILGDDRLTPKEKTQYLAVLTFERLKAHLRITQPEGLNQQENITMGSEDIRQHIKARRMGKNSISAPDEGENPPKDARQRFARMAENIEHNLGERSIREKVRIITAADLYTRKARLSENIHYLDKSTDKTLFIDTGKSIAVSKNGMSESAVTVALELAKEKFGSTLTVKGSQAFKNTVIEAVAQKGMDVHFTDKEMNRRLAERKAELAVEREGQNIAKGETPDLSLDDFKKQFEELKEQFSELIKKSGGMEAEDLQKEVHDLCRESVGLRSYWMSSDVYTPDIDFDTDSRKLEKKALYILARKYEASNQQTPTPKTREEFISAFSELEKQYLSIRENAGDMDGVDLFVRVDDIRDERKALTMAYLELAGGDPHENLDDRCRSLEAELMNLSEQKIDAEQPTPETERQAQPGASSEKHIIHEGILLEHGEAPYQFQPDMSKPEAERNDSYYVKLQRPDGSEKVVWGVTLEKAVQGLDIGERISLENMGKEKVEWQQKLADGSVETRTGERVAWEGRPLDRDIDNAGAQQGTTYEESESWEERDYSGPDVA